jgi:hypothetical protein
VCALAFVASARLNAASASAIFQSGPGRFEVAGADAAAAKTVVDFADEAWRRLAEPLGLPAGFPSPIFCRIVPAASWTDASPFRVLVESGGVVALRLRWDAATPEIFVRRALVQALLMRLAVAQHGVNEKLAAPLWLELACVEWWRTRSEAAQFDALKFESDRIAPPALDEILGAQRGAAEARALALGAVWLLAFLQSESTKAGEWPALESRLLAGDEVTAALAATFPNRFANAAERELWWQTGWHHLRRARALPALDAADSRRELAAAARFVFATDDGTDIATPLGEVFSHAGEPIVAAEIQRRATALNRLLPVLHPFYRNAGLSLAEVFAGRAPAETFERDWRDAIELESATSAALDALEAKRN